MVSDASSEDIFDSEAVNLELHALDNQHLRLGEIADC